MGQREGTYSACIIRPVMREHKLYDWFHQNEQLLAL